MRSGVRYLVFTLFFFNDTATTEIYTLSLHDALPISPGRWSACSSRPRPSCRARSLPRARRGRTAGHVPPRAAGETCILTWRVLEDARVIRIETETDIERLRQVALLQRAELDRLYQRLAALTEGLARARGGGAIDALVLEL